MDEISGRSGAGRRNDVRVGLLAERSEQQQSVLSTVDNLGWQVVELPTWTPLEGAQSDLDLLVLSVERIRRSVLATISDAALDPHLRILVLADDRNPQTIADVLRCGAHDYLVSPFAPAELEARMVALVTRVWPTSERRMGGGLHFDFANRTVATGPYSVTFTSLEWDILITLLECDGQPIAAGHIVDELTNHDLQPASVSAIVSRIRRKLDNNDFKALTIDTVQGRGYIARFRRSSDQLKATQSKPETFEGNGMPGRAVDPPCRAHGVRANHTNLYR